MNDFSYARYIQLIQTLKQVIPLRDFVDIQSTTKSFLIIRHDVEFSVEKAYDLACIEQEQLGIQTSYFFQLRNYTYNPLAFSNVALIKKIHAMGHRIGLHVNMTDLSPEVDLSAFIKEESMILQQGLGLSIDRFSFHRPSHATLALALKIPGLINTYDPQYFHFYEGAPPEALRVYYFSDSEHRWKHGHPESILEKPVKKIQLLTHPYSWSEEGLDNTLNFKALIQRQYTSLLEGMHHECKNFPEALLNAK